MSKTIESNAKLEKLDTMRKSIEQACIEFHEAFSALNEAEREEFGSANYAGMEPFDAAGFAGDLEALLEGNY